MVCDLEIEKAEKEYREACVVAIAVVKIIARKTNNKNVRIGASLSWDEVVRECFACNGFIVSLNNVFCVEIAYESDLMETFTNFIRMQISPGDISFLSALRCKYWVV